MTATLFESHSRPSARRRPAMTFGSLFAGIGGFDLGLERAGMRCVWQVEIDEYCRRVLAKHWPDVRRHDDARTWPTPDAERPDVICGGFPCQDISNAGEREGITGARSGLWFEFARIIRDLRPRFVVVENVSALLARGMGTVLGELAALGYDAEWECIPATAVGAPHHRDRVWIVAYPQCPERWPGQPGRNVADRETPERQKAASRIGAPGPDGGIGPLADAKRNRRQQSSEVPSRRESVFAVCCRDGSGNQVLGRLKDSGDWLTEPDVGRVAYGVPARVDRLRGLGNAVVPQIAEWIGRWIIEVESATPAPQGTLFAPATFGGST